MFVAKTLNRLRYREIRQEVSMILTFLSGALFYKNIFYFQEFETYIFVISVSQKGKGIYGPPIVPPAYTTV
jgi:hypothetical protein